MTLSIPLSPQAEEKLRQRAAAAGVDPNVYVLQLLEDVFTKPDINEILAPFREQVAKSGMTDEQLETFYDDLRNEAWQDRQDNGK